MRRILLAIDVFFNRRTYIRQARAAGFIVDERTTNAQLVDLFVNARFV